MSFNYVPPRPSPSPELFYAETVYQRIEKLLTSALKKLKDGQNLLVEVPLNHGRVIFPSHFGYQNPNFIIVYGQDENGNEVRAFLQHTSIQIITTIIDKPEERKSIGFVGQGVKPEI
jgi:hypothetical protein